jgi:hypothetical protein
MSEDEGVTVRRRTDAFAWDRELYRPWMIGGACWLDNDPKNGDDDSGVFQQFQQVSAVFQQLLKMRTVLPAFPVSAKEVIVQIILY